jgi:5'-methylthioadenosine phosphorylase
MLAIIGGSGLTQLANLNVTHREVVRTPYGEPSGALTFGSVCGQPLVFLARHGYGHTLAPHEINYRANLWALHARGVSGIIAVASVGGIRSDLKPGDIVIPHQIIDYTAGRANTFFEGDGRPVMHVDFTDPYDAALRTRLLAAARVANVPVAAGAVYACTQGPRLETAAEIVRIERDGGDVVGMTGMPEAALARELELPYAAINVIANYAAGRGDSVHGISFDAIQEVLEHSMGQVRGILENLWDCGCQ